MEGAMRKAHYTVSGKDVQEHAESLIRKHLGLGNHSKKCNSGILLKVLFAATARLTSIFAACLHLKDAPSCETIRKALLATLPDYAELQRGVNRALAGDIPKTLRRKKQRIAIDLHLRPYYGKPHKTPRKSIVRKPRTAPTTFTPMPARMSCAKGNATRLRSRPSNAA